MWKKAREREKCEVPNRKHGNDWKQIKKNWVPINLTANICECVCFATDTKKKQQKNKRRRKNK